MNETVIGAYNNFNDYFELTKPRITLLVLFTTLMGMLVSTASPLQAELVIYTLIGTALASSSSGILNNFYDRDIDPLMKRTRVRALASGRVEPARCFYLGIALAIVSFLLLWIAVNPLTALLATFTIAFYVCVYTRWLKRSTPLCTEIGGIAGAMPPLIGAAAVTGSVTAPALLLFLLMFLWQPPHFWALALLRADEYRDAGIPMLPVVSGERVTRRRMLYYTLSLVPVSFAICWVFKAAPWLYLFVAVLNIVYIVKTINFIRSELSRKTAMNLFGFSILYLFLMFCMLFFMA